MITAAEIDLNGLVRPQYEWRVSGNGMFYSSVAMMLQGGVISPQVAQAMRILWQKDSGVLYRTPDNQFGQESHDNYTGLAYLCLTTNDRKLARSVFWAMVRKFGYMKNVPLDLAGKRWRGKGGKLDRLMAPWQLRFIHVPALFLYTAYPNTITKRLALLALKITLKLSKTDPGNQSGTQLKFFVANLLWQIGGEQDVITELLLELKPYGGIGEVMRPYYAPGHGIVALYKEYEKMWNI